jgi:Na+/melibiose symporter-like transporter
MAWRRLFLALLVNLAILALTYVGFNYGYNEGGPSAWFAIPSYIIGMVGLLALLGLIAFAAIYALTRAVVRFADRRARKRAWRES